MAVFTGWWALGTGVSNKGQFLEATTYTRPAVSMTGNAQSGLTQNISQITGPTGPTGGIITKGAIFDALTGGNCLCYWDWPSSAVVTVPSNFAAITANITLNTYLMSQLTLSAAAAASSSGALVDQGSQIGFLNGQPMVAATTLGIQGGGLLAYPGGVDSRQSMDGPLHHQFGGVDVFVVGSDGGLTLGAVGQTAVGLTTNGKLTVNAGGVDLLINVGGVAVASIGTAGNLILRGTVTASGTPS